jgi:hypothetical protein
MGDAVEMAGSGHVAEIDPLSAPNGDTCVESRPYRTLAKEQRGNHAGLKRCMATEEDSRHPAELYGGGRSPAELRTDRLSVQRPGPVDPETAFCESCVMRPEQPMGRGNYFSP